MSEQDVQQLRSAYDGFNAGNPNVVLEMCAADVEWVEPGGGNAAEGTFTSPQSVGEEVFSTIPQYFDEFAAQPENFDDQGDTIIVTGRFKGKAKSGTELNAPFEHVFEMQEGEIKRMENNVQDNWAEAWS